jgi:hypothetical protein
MGRPCESQRSVARVRHRRGGGRGRRRDLVGVVAVDLGVVDLALVPRLTSLRDHLRHLPARGATGVTAAALARAARERAGSSVRAVTCPAAGGGGRGKGGGGGGQHRPEGGVVLARVRPADACSRRKVRDLRVAMGDILSFRRPCTYKQ